MKSTTQKNNITVKNIIEKIRTLREFNKNPSAGIVRLIGVCDKNV